MEINNLRLLAPGSVRLRTDLWRPKIAVGC
jgi:hypothetical protein